MAWGTIELEPEVRDWLLTCDPYLWGRAHFAIELLAEQGVALDQPYTRQLRGKLRELRFRAGADAWRITYWIASKRRIILLTVFRKSQRQERAEIERAAQAMARCIDAGHTPDEEN